jgi:hypothetical protein
MASRDELYDRFQDNLDRVRGLVESYDSSGRRGSGRRSVKETDLLRAAVVFLHATLEDLLRGLCEWKMPSANPEAFSDIPLAGTRGKTRFGLAELAVFRGRTVDEIITESVNEFLEKETYNHPGDIKAVLAMIGIDPTIVNKYARTLAAMMSRRHWIAHRADRRRIRRPGDHAVMSLSSYLVSHWITTVDKFGDDLRSAV